MSILYIQFIEIPNYSSLSKLSINSSNKNCMNPEKNIFHQKQIAAYEILFDRKI